MKRYHDDFPDAPQALVSGISAACAIPTIIGARVGRDGSIFLDVFQDENFSLDLGHLSDIAEFCQVEPEELRIENGPDIDSVTVSVCSSGFDFSAQFEDEGVCSGGSCHIVLPGTEDSEESVEAHASTLNRRV